MADLEEGEIPDSDDSNAEETGPMKGPTPSPENGNEPQKSDPSESKKNVNSTLPPQFMFRQSSCPLLGGSTGHEGRSNYRSNTPTAVCSSSDSSEEDTDLWKRKKAKYFRHRKEKSMDLAPEIGSPVKKSHSDPRADTSDEMLDITEQPKRKINNVWGSVLQEQTLTQTLGSINVDKHELCDNERDVESYDYTKKYEDSRPSISYRASDDEDVEPSHDPFNRVVELEEEDIYSHRRRGRKRKKGIKDRLGGKRSCLFRMQEIKIAAEDTEEKVIATIADLLNEQKVEIIERIVQAVGKEKAISLLHQTKQVEDGGGMMTMDGSRRRTPGGVYIQLMKTDKDSTKDQKKIVFKEEYEKRAQEKKLTRQRRRERAAREKATAVSFYTNQRLLEEAPMEGVPQDTKKVESSRERKNSDSDSDSSADKDRKGDNSIEDVDLDADVDIAVGEEDTVD